MNESTIHAFTTYGPAGASARVRLHDWFRHCRVDAVIHDYIGLGDARPGTILRHPLAVGEAELELAKEARETHDVAIVSREASPFSWGGLEGRLLSSARHGVYDIDDALFDDAGSWRRWLHKREKATAGARHADVVVAGSDYLAEWAEQWNSQVFMVPSCVDPLDYIRKSSWEIGGGPPRMVWLGSPATEHFVDSIAAPLAEVNQRTGAVLVLISGTRRVENPILQSFVERHLWSQSDWRALLATSDVAIAPLDGSPYSRGKCAYKVLQYAATGLPVVGSPVGANRLAIDRFDGLAVESLDEWIDALVQSVTESAARRSRRGAQGFAAVKRFYSFEAWEGTWRQATGI